MHIMIRRLGFLALTLLVSSTARADLSYVQTNLVTNDQSVVTAQQTDPNLINPWGVSFSTGSPIWVSNQGSGTATVYQLTGTTSSPTLLTVSVPNLGGAPPSGADGPTG